MGLKADIENAMDAAFDGDLADAVKSFTHYSITVPDYDPGTGVTRITVEDEGRGVFDSFTKEELEDETISPSDVKLIVLQKELSNPLTKEDRILRIDTNVLYDVIGWGNDPADVIYEIQLRTVSDARQ